ncbi:MAG: putative sensor protein [Fibrobacteres bacterium]|nr:putative sensor protein [Fibrobacterota bacterium]
MIGRQLLNRVFWIEAICFGLLIVFISVDDEYLLPKLITPASHWTTTTIAGLLDSFGVGMLFLLAIFIQVKYVNKIKILEGMLSVCANCKKIRDGENHWHPIEDYIQQRSNADFSHTICPDCGIKLYGDLYLRATGAKPSKEP